MAAKHFSAAQACDMLAESGDEFGSKSNSELSLSDFKDTDRGMEAYMHNVRQFS